MTTLIEVSPDKEQVTLTNLLNDKLGEPYIRSNFLQYLKSVQAEENLEFFTEVQEFKGYFKEVKPVSFRDKLLRDNTSVAIEKVLEKQRSIREVYLAVGAPNEINISGELRQKLNEELETSCDRGEAVPNTFDTCVDEVYSMLDGTHFYNFVKYAELQNVSIEDRASRVPRMSVLFPLFLLVETALVLFEVEVLFRLIPVVMLFSVVQDFFTWKEGFCPYLACARKYMQVQDVRTWIDIVFGWRKSEVESNVIESDELAKVVFRRGMYGLLRVWFGAWAIVTPFLFIPPGVLD